MKRFLATCLISTSLFAAANANAYFVRPFHQLGGSFVDGLVQNGATSSSQNFGSSLQSIVDLNTGTVRSLVDISGTNQFAQAGGSFGDTFSFSNNSVGTVADFSFAFDGTIDIENVINAGSFLQYGVSANFFVFEAGSGATYSNFTSIGGELIGRSDFLSFENPESDVSDFINESLSGSLVIGGVQDFDIFASLSVFVSTNLNPVSARLDFLNTGTFGIEVADNVTYSSQSGVLLDSVVPNPAPAPGTLALLGLGMIGLASRRRLRRTD